MASPIASDDEDDECLITRDVPEDAKTSEKKRAEAAVFQEWVIKNQREITDKAAARALQSLDKLPSIAETIRKEDSPKIIESPREYQIDMFERAKLKNIIAVLPTGSGKTLIAVLLLKHVLDEELEFRANAPDRTKKIAFFIVEKVALCFQQYGVLKDNLEHRIGQFYGDMSGRVNTREFWDGQFKDNMAIVTTAQVLLDCLNNGFIGIHQINLLVFDEAHHGKKQHPYAKIMKSHYMLERDPLRRPKILGMTASPVDTQTRDMRGVATELEDMMCSEIATVSGAELQRGQSEKKLLETTEKFSTLPNPEESKTALWDAIESQVRANSTLRSALDFTLDASSKLGPWCADRYWFKLLTDLETTKLMARTEAAMGEDSASARDEAVEAIHEIQKIVQGQRLQPVSRTNRPPQISSKVDLLWRILQGEFRDKGAQRCIVFVEKRYTAVLLADLLQQPGMRIPGVVSSYMIGSEAASSGIASMSFRDQVLALLDFKRGETTCLFATSVGEEGIDIPSCDLVIRFDMYKSVIQYVQSRGRARQQYSRFINMLEEDNMRDLGRLKRAAWDSNILQQFCSALPEDRKVQDPLIDMGSLALAEHAAQKTHEIAETGARLSFENSLQILSTFTSSLGELGGPNLSPEFIVMVFGNKFSADVILPETSPVNCVSGFPQRNKQLARCSAAYEACMMLLKRKFINNHLRPVFARQLPVMRNARLAVSSNKRSEYTMRIKPNMWSRLEAQEPSSLFATAIVLENPDALGKSSLPLILLTREELPQENVPLFFGKGCSSLVRFIPSKAAVKFSGRQVDLLRGFTLKVFKDVFSKEYEAASSETPFFLGPATEQPETLLTSTDGPANAQATVNWDGLEDIQSHEYLDWDGQAPEFFEERFVIDPVDGSRKFMLHGINPELKPGDRTPTFAPMPKSRAYRSVEPIIKEYSNSLFLKARQQAQWRDDQPVVNAELVSLRRNFLDQFEVDDDSDNRCCIIMEPLRVSSLPVPIVNMATLLPAVMHRLDSSLIALDACSLLGLSIRPDLALEAMTKDSNNTDEHGEEQLDFQPGMGANYERLEFLGDTFLKMATTISLCTILPFKVEFEYHVERMLLVCNQNLFNGAVGEDRKLYEYVRSKGFNRRSWYPNLPLKRGKAPKTEMRHALSNKSIADVCEALIGAAYLSTPGNMDMAVRAVTKMVKSKKHKMHRFKSYYAAYKLPSWIKETRVTAAHRATAEGVAESIGYTFSLPTLLISALKHPSYPYEKSIPDYQRLEFLGDALLDMAIVDHLFHNYPRADPKWLTEHKMAMVSNQFLSCLCVKLNLHSRLMITTAALIGQRVEYVAALQRAEEAALKEAQDGIPRKNFWLDTTDAPKGLADIVEAVVGAMFVDSGYDYSVVQTFFTRHVLPYFEDMELYDTFASKHPVRMLSNRLQTVFGCQNSGWQVAQIPSDIQRGAKSVTESEVVCAVMVHGKVFEHATARSGRYARVACAKRASKKLDDMDAARFKGETGCDCA